MWLEKVDPTLKQRFLLWLNKPRSYVSFFTLDELKQIRDVLGLTYVKARKGSQEFYVFSDDRLASANQARIRLLVTAIIAMKLNYDEMPLCEHCKANRVISKPRVDFDGKKAELSIAKAKSLTKEEAKLALTTAGKLLCPICAMKIYEIDRELARQNSLKGVQAFKERMKDEEYRQRFREKHREAALRSDRKTAALKRQKTLLERYGVLNAKHVDNEKHRQVIECLQNKGYSFTRKFPMQILVDYILEHYQESTIEPLIKDPKLAFEVGTKFHELPFQCKKCGLQYSSRVGAPIVRLNQLICQRQPLDQVFACRRCNASKSSLEGRLALFLQKQGFKIKLNVRQGPWEYDLLVTLPGSSVKVFVEVLGEFYHSTAYMDAFKVSREEHLQRAMSKLQRKVQFERENKLLVIRLWSFELNEDSRLPILKRHTEYALLALLNRAFKLAKPDSISKETLSLSAVETYPVRFEYLPFDDGKFIASEDSKLVFMQKDNQVAVIYDAIKVPGILVHVAKKLGAKQLLIPYRWYSYGTEVVPTFKPSIPSSYDLDPQSDFLRETYPYITLAL